MTKTLSTLQPHVLGLLRFITGYTFFLHGTAKLFSLPHLEMFDGLQLMSLTGVAGMLEVGGGLLIMLGLYTRVAAFILSGQMAVAYFMFHASVDNFWLPLTNYGESAVLFCFIFFYLVFAGGGAFAVDNRLSKHNNNAAKNV